MTVPADVLTRLRELCLGLPETYEEQAWIGTRWRIRKKTFAHTFVIEDGHPEYYAKVATAEGTILTFRSPPEELHALSNGGHPFFKTVWPPDMIGMAIEDDVDWAEVAELLTESYRVLAPQKLGRLLGEG
ncbi:putative DNA-binding protein (MmcQ/YjbR family) [Kibdelosporangium banguiense]|uniref:DNA-binding protein (MmcQ/YjbR family) n=1 Tax=Kibdelosporangium banguiense TaxID=1365924 RepID=A0ABS4T6D1_9PSEU|nr:MmcQ/YjbR family DNA-binding protein [Kibdelosporangium banguiense]MBP2319982.1 putative DNA-binding protein (MmcQ/YjbR family) [Kibdelosporangium banguiense]